VLPDFTPEGDLPVGVHFADWEEFVFRFGTSTARRVWLQGRLYLVQSLLVWGSFATAKASPEDVDLLLILDEDFEMQCMYSAPQAVCDSVRHYESDVFWARACIG
jgi:hypothetical protein